MHAQLVIFQADGQQHMYNLCNTNQNLKLPVSTVLKSLFGC